METEFMQKIAQACYRRGVDVAEVALTGKGMPEEATIEKDDGATGKSINWICMRNC